MLRLNPRDSEPLQVEACRRLCLGMHTNLCLDLCDPREISSRWNIWSIPCQAV